MTTRMPPVMDPTAALRSERNQILAALADVLRYVEPCGHEPPDPQCCTDCHARALIARNDARVEIEVEPLRAVDHEQVPVTTEV